MSDNNTPGKAYGAFVKAFAEVQSVGKGGTMKDGGQFYRYQRYEDILPVVRAALANNGLAPMPVDFEVTPEEFRTTKNGARQYVVQIKATYRLYADDGSYVEGKGIGRGADSGDKDISKAQTYAYKWFLTQTFQIATENSADPDSTLMEETFERETDAQRMLRERREAENAHQAAEAPQVPPPRHPAPVANGNGRPVQSVQQRPAGNGQIPQAAPLPPLVVPADGDLKGWQTYVMEAAHRVGFVLADDPQRRDVPAIAAEYTKAIGAGATMPTATIGDLRRFAEHLKGIGIARRQGNGNTPAAKAA